MKEPLSPELLNAAQKGDEAALASVIARQMPVLRRYARAAVRPGLDFDDAVQEGLIGLFRAIESYDEAGGAAFGTYASRCIHNAVASARRAAGRKKHEPLNQSVPIPEDKGIPGPEEMAIAREQVNQTLEKVQRRLSPFEKDVLRLRLEGCTTTQIARRLGRPAKAVANALTRVRSKLR